MYMPFCIGWPLLLREQSVEEVQARHKKELKALDGTGRKLVKQANKNKAKLVEAEAKIAKVRRDLVPLCIPQGAIVRSI